MIESQEKDIKWSNMDTWSVLEEFAGADSVVYIG